MKKKKEIMSIKTVLENYFKKKKWQKKIKVYQIINSWDDVVDKKIAQHSQPIKIQGETLFLKVKSNVWANELNLRKGEIINKINLKMGEKVISEILFKVH